MITEKSNKLNGNFEIDETYENNTWIRTNIRTLAFGKNRNQSDISESSIRGFSKARKSIGAVPIVARYNMETDDLEGHNVILRKNKDDEYEMFHDTDALGFTSPNSTFYLEEVNEGTETSPDFKTYMVIKDVYLWKRFDATKRILEWRDEGVQTSVSVEIDEVEGQFDNEGYFSISDFNFSGICALGSEVEPCFSQAEIQLYSANEFKSDLKQLMFELTNQDNNKELNNNVEITKDFNEESGGNKLSKELAFELTHQQLSAKLRQDLEVHRFIDKDGESARRYWYQDHTNTKVIYEDLAEAGQLYESPYTVNGNDVTIDLGDKVEASLAFIPNSRSGNGEGRRGRDYNLETELEKAEAKLAEFEAQLTAKEEATEETVESLKTKHAEEFTALKAEYSETVAGMKTDLEALSSKSADFEAVMTEVESLREFKRNAEVDAVRAKFSGKLTDESLETILSANFEASTDELEAMIFAEIGKQNFSLVEESKAPTSVQFSQRKESKDDGYNGLFTQFSAK